MTVIQLFSFADICDVVRTSEVKMRREVRPRRGLLRHRPRQRNHLAVGHDRAPHHQVHRPRQVRLRPRFHSENVRNVFHDFGFAGRKAEGDFSFFILIICLFNLSSPNFSSYMDIF